MIDVRLIDADALMATLSHNCYPVQHDMTSIEPGMTLMGILQAIQEQPTIEPQRWIPVTEKLPEEDGEYLVANRTIKGKPYVYGIDTFANDLYQVDKYDFSDKKGKRGWVYFHDEYGYLEDKTVVAWMPLPDAYMGK